MDALEPGPATVQHVIRRFGLPFNGGSLTAVARGSMGRVWRLDLTRPVDGAGNRAEPERYALKEFFWGTGEYAEQDAKVEVEFQTAAMAAGIRAPLSVPTVDGTYLERLPAALGGVVIRLGEWVAGQRPQDSDPDRALYLGETLGTLHRLDYPTKAQPGPWFTVVTTPEQWAELVERTTASSDLIPVIAEQLPGRVPELLSLSGLVDATPQDDLICSHRDVQPVNILVDPASGIRTLIDWDEAGPISPGRELATQLWAWHLHDNTVDPDGVKQTVRAYREAGGTAELTGIDVFSLCLTTDLNYLAGQISAALADDLPPPMRQHAQNEAEKLLFHMPNPQHFEEILLAAGTA